MAYQLKPISVEQQEIVNKLKEGLNVNVAARPGSGKTVSALYVAKLIPEWKILLLTYNKKLKLETRQKRDDLHLSNLEIHSYHSMVVKYYNRTAFTDVGITKILKNNAKKLQPFKYDLIICDEFQDCNEIYFELITKIYKDNENPNCKICIFADPNQSIYDFNDADQRFSLLADKLFTFTNNSFVNLGLSETFRVNKPTVEFINNCVLNRPGYIISNKLGPKPKYIICNTFDESEEFISYKLLLEYLRAKDKDGKNLYTGEDIFVLSSSVKSKNAPCRILGNRLTNKGIPIYVASSDEEKVDEEVLKGKISFITFHQSKGLERKIVFIFGFDMSYYKYYDKHANPNNCPNAIYVGITRSLEHLILLHDKKNGYLPFLKKGRLQNHVEFISTAKRVGHTNIEQTETTNLNASDLSKHLSSNLMDKLVSFAEIKEIQSPSNVINIPIKIDSIKNGESIYKIEHQDEAFAQATDANIKNRPSSSAEPVEIHSEDEEENYDIELDANITFENVSEITGLCLPSHFELEYTKKSSMFDTLENVEYFNNKKFLIGMKEKISEFIKSFSNTSSPSIIEGNELVHSKQPNTIEQLLKLCNLWKAYVSEYDFKLLQIKNYNWIPQEALDESYNRLFKNVAMSGLVKELQFEKLLTLNQAHLELQGRQLLGYADCIAKIADDEYALWEFKCTSQLEREHIIQTMIYAYIMEMLRLEELNDIRSERRSMGSTYKLSDHVIQLNEQRINTLNKIKYRYFLYNILTDQILEINIPIEKLVEFMKYLIHNKYNRKGMTDEDFINKMQEIVKKRFG